MHKYMSISILDSDAHILMCVLVGVLVSILCVNLNLQERNREEKWKMEISVSVKTTLKTTFLSINRKQKLITLKVIF